MFRKLFSCQGLLYLLVYESHVNYCAARLIAVQALVSQTNIFFRSDDLCFQEHNKYCKVKVLILRQNHPKI